MDRKNDWGEFPLVITFPANDKWLQSSHLSMQKTMNKHLKMTIQLLKLHLELAIYRCKNDEHTTKNGDFNQKKMKAYSKMVILSL